MAKQALIVGGSKGIGAELAQKLMNAGCELTIFSRTAPDFEGDYTHQEVDVLNDEIPVLDKPIDALAYCPGSINLKPFKGLRRENYMEDLEINFFGAVKVLQAYEKKLKASENGSVVLFSTVAVQTGMPFHSSIAAAKGAVEGLARSLAAEWAPKVRVNAIAPSLTQTDLAGRLLRTEKQIEASNDRHPLERIGQPEDVASLAAYLLTDQSSWMSGQVIQLDGGMSGIRKI